MSGFLNFLIFIVAIGVVSLFATFFIICGLNKREIWNEIYKKILFK